MIEDKEKGIRIAENDDEVLWNSARLNAEQNIIQAKKIIEEQEKVLKMNQRKIVYNALNFAKEKIKHMKNEIKISKDIKNLFESKLKKSVKGGKNNG